MLLKILTNKVTLVLGVISTLLTVVITYSNYQFDQGYKSASTDIQAEYNKKISTERQGYDRKLKKQFDAYKKSLEKSEKKINQYWDSILTKQKSDLTAAHETELKAIGIKNEADKIDLGQCDVISDDALRLFNEATSIVSYSDSGNDTENRFNPSVAQATPNTTTVTATLLSRFIAKNGDQ